MPNPARLAHHLGPTLALVLLALFVCGCCVPSQTLDPPYPSGLERYAWPTLDGQPPVVIAHRGKSQFFPDNTLIAYQWGAQSGDYVETDIVLTKDGVPICRHDLYLSKTTDVAARPEFADRKRKLGNKTDWFVMDFTLDEIKKLRAVQPVANRDQSHNGQHTVPTLAELFRLMANLRRNSGRDIGVYIEIKQPAAHRRAGMDLTAAIMDVLERHEAEHGPMRVVYQSFDRSEVERLTAITDRPVSWLVSKKIDLDDLPRGIVSLGLKKDLVEIEDGRSILVDAAHAKGLAVNCWTFRQDRPPPGQKGSEIAQYLRAGVDGVICDFPSSGAASREVLAGELPEVQQEKVKPLSQRVREKSPRRFIRSY
ncbi:MAG: hypothetical protein KTR15_08300 [Phycisphaeraceae bacterium]|nr:hypothetical protein [Phycisphaeraceae bacterium]